MGSGPLIASYKIAQGLLLRSDRIELIYGSRGALLINLIPLLTLIIPSIPN